MRGTFSFRIIASLVTIVLGALSVAAQATGPAPTVASTVPVGQTPSPDKSQRRPSTRRSPQMPSRVTVVPNQSELAPQVVTIIHRLTGIKLLRLLQWQSGESFAIENV